MNYSMNETKSMVQRAARGAGFSWGMAEDTAKAVSWLCSYGLPGVEMLVQTLEMHDQYGSENLKPDTDRFPIAGNFEQLCPIITGTMLSDYAHRLPNDGLQVHKLAQPLLCVPFIANIALTQQTIACITWQDITISTDGHNTSIQQQDHGTHRALWSPHASILEYRFSTNIGAPATTTLRVNVSTDTWQALEKHAHRTYAPATDASRALGAG